MAQADQQIDNASFPAVRTDITDNLAALFSQSSGPSAPAVTVAYQPWIDTSSSPAVWKVRNGTNTGWITVGTIDTTGGTFAVGGIAPIANGGTGATTAAAALTALLPSQSGNSGKALLTNGASALWGLVATGASAQLFTSSGTYTPTAGKTTALVIATGGGGGGANGSLNFSGGSGGGGGTGLRLYTSTEIGSTAAVAVGAGGAAGYNGSSGGTSSFTPTGSGLSLSGIGGTGGTNSGVTGAGGSATNSLFNIIGTTTSGGGLSFFMAGPGKGGSGGTSNYGAGTAGTAGLVFILEW